MNITFEERTPEQIIQDRRKEVKRALDTLVDYGLISRDDFYQLHNRLDRINLFTDQDINK